MWREITFLQLLHYIEQAQSQLRAENGIEEIVVGYIGENDEALYEFDQNQVSDLLEGIGSEGVQTTAADLPEGVREVYLSEMHRLRTGETRPAHEFKSIKTTDNG